jgi:hypothetical protein
VKPQDWREETRRTRADLRQYRARAYSGSEGEGERKNKPARGRIGEDQSRAGCLQEVARSRVAAAGLRHAGPRALSMQPTPHQGFFTNKEYEEAGNTVAATAPSTPSSSAALGGGGDEEAGGAAAAMAVEMWGSVGGGGGGGSTRVGEGTTDGVAGVDKEPPTAVGGEKMKCLGAGGGGRGEGAGRVKARRGRVKGEPMGLSYFHTF